MNEFLAGSCFEPEGIARLPGGHGKAQEIGNKIGLELMGLEKARALVPPPLCDRYCVEGRRWPQGRGLGHHRDPLGGLSRPPLTEVGLAQVTNPSCSPFLLLGGGGGSRGWGRESEIAILWASLSQSFRPQDTSQN